jgi:hypothetical protein
VRIDKEATGSYLRSNRSLAAKVAISFAMNEHPRKIEVKTLTSRDISLIVD